MRKLSLNRIIWYLTCSDLANWGLYFSVIALIGLYLEQRLGANTIQYIGIGTAIYSIVRAGSQIPFGVLTDKVKGDRDEIMLLGLGNFLMGGAFLLYPLVTNPWLFYVIQVFFGLGAGLNLVTWRKLFARHLDTGNEGVEYGSYETIMSIFMAVASAAVGTIARISTFYFELVIITVGIGMLSGVLWPFLIYREKFKG